MDGIYSIPGQTEGRRKAFLEWTSIDLSSKPSLTYGGNVDYYKCVHHPIPTLTVEIGNTHAIFKTINKLSFQLSVQVCSLLVQSEGERKAFFEGCKKGGHIVRLPPRTLGCHKR